MPSGISRRYGNTSLDVMRQHDRGDEHSFADTPLGDAHGLHAVDEHLTGPSTRETDEPVGPVTGERSVVDGHLSWHHGSQHVGPPLADHP